MGRMDRCERCGVLEYYAAIFGAPDAFWGPCCTGGAYSLVSRHSRTARMHFKVFTSAPPGMNCPPHRSHELAALVCPNWEVDYNNSLT